MMRLRISIPSQSRGVPLTEDAGLISRANLDPSTDTNTNIHPHATVQELCLCTPPAPLYSTALLGLVSGPCCGRGTRLISCRPNTRCSSSPLEGTTRVGLNIVRWKLKLRHIVPHAEALHNIISSRPNPRLTATEKLKTQDSVLSLQGLRGWDTL